MFSFSQGTHKQCAKWELGGNGIPASLRIGGQAMVCFMAWNVIF